jgi:hypothetical protein
MSNKRLHRIPRRVTAIHFFIFAFYFRSAAEESCAQGSVGILPAHMLRSAAPERCLEAVNVASGAVAGSEIRPYLP